MAAQANIKAVITAEDRASSTLSGFGASFGKMAGSFAVGQLAANAFSFAVDKVVQVTKESVGAAFDQVRQVENATFALKAYERDASKVNKVLGELVEFARSDMGTLFQREELFKAASNLRAFGIASDEITDKVKILARGVSLGMTTFDELSQIIGRVAQKGRLDANEFDMLAQRGIVLDQSFRGAKVSSEQLFNELSRVLPADLLAGRANTIDGIMIKLKSAFRDLGSEILGVDKSTSTFIEGGLGDRAMKALVSLTEYLKKPENKEAIKDFAEGLLLVGKALAWVGGIVVSTAKQIQLFSADVGLAIGYVMMWFTDAGRAIERFGYNAQGVVHNVVSFFQQLPGRIMSAVSGFGNLLYNVGRDLVQGLINGIGSIGGQIGERIKGFANDAVKTAKNILGIKSPSKVFEGIGENIGLGMVEGINNTAGAVANSLNGLTAPTVSVAGSNVANPPVAQSNTSNTTVNITLSGVFAGTPGEARKLAQMVAENLKTVANQRNMTVMEYMS